ncbi:integrase catalytic domain-containing protein [Nephila pilipes]|uniref:Integrase catalytic domain-containing protein n=1 Tax=Nephila pilipes TaxID=299642 RepID=A0A8X6PF97_NEPPI|nr:integrase catalytic domain-containing protein [Nephila pilipes]
MLLSLKFHESILLYHSIKSPELSFILRAVFTTIQLELTTSLTTENFQKSFRIYMARSGTPSIVYSDNGTNLVGANNLIKRINWETVSKHSTVDKIDRKLIPPSAIWWGGFWERLIGMIE